MNDNSDDLFIYCLRRHLEILDVEIVDILAKIGTSNDPEAMVITTLASILWVLDLLQYKST